METTRLDLITKMVAQTFSPSPVPGEAATQSANNTLTQTFAAAVRS